MCRLLAWVTPEPRLVSEAVGPQSLAEFVALSGIHRDGWGMAWDPSAGSPTAPRTGQPLEAVRSAKCAAEDPRFAECCARLYADAGIAHLRWATPGMAVVAENSHPFRRGDLAMAHNGGIYPLDRIGEILPPVWESEVRGSTDSERYVLAVAAAQESSGAPVEEVLSDVITRLFDEWNPTSLNAVCLTSQSVVVVSAFNPHAPVSAVPQPAEQYYELRYRTSPDGVVVASSGIDQPASGGWQPLDNMTVSVIDRHSCELTVHPLAVPPPSAWAPGVATPGLLR